MVIQQSKVFEARQRSSFLSVRDFKNEALEGKKPALEGTGATLMKTSVGRRCHI
jgi:hypothetical protein